METLQEFIQAAFDGHILKMKKLLPQVVDINEQPGMGWNPLHAAIENENLECVDFLVENGADVESIYRATSHPSSNTLSPLAHAVDIAIDGSNQNGVLPGDEPTDIVDYLIGKGANPNTAIETAENYQNEKFIKLLRKVCGGS